MVRFCREHPEDGACKPQLEFALSNDDAIATLASSALAQERAKAGDDHSTAGIKAVFALAPVVQPLTPASLQALRQPVVLMVGGADVTVPAATHSLVAKSMIPGSTVTILPSVTHYDFLATCSAAAVSSLPVCRDAASQKRAHRAAIQAALHLFDGALR